MTDTFTPAEMREQIVDIAMPVVEAIRRDYAPDLDENDGGQILVWLRDFGLKCAALPDPRPGETTGEKCPLCSGHGRFGARGNPQMCSACNGTGKREPAAPPLAPSSEQGHVHVHGSDPTCYGCVIAAPREPQPSSEIPWQDAYEVTHVNGKPVSPSSEASATQTEEAGVGVALVEQVWAFRRQGVAVEAEPRIPREPREPHAALVKEIDEVISVSADGIPAWASSVLVVRYNALLRRCRAALIPTGER